MPLHVLDPQLTLLRIEVHVVSGATKRSILPLLDKGNSWHQVILVLHLDDEFAHETFIPAKDGILAKFLSSVLVIFTETTRA